MYARRSRIPRDRSAVRPRHAGTAVAVMKPIWLIFRWSPYGGGTVRVPKCFRKASRALRTRCSGARAAIMSLKNPCPTSASSAGWTVAVRDGGDTYTRVGQINQTTTHTRGSRLLPGKECGTPCHRGGGDEEEGDEVGHRLRVLLFVKGRGGTGGGGEGELRVGRRRVDKWTGRAERQRIALLCS